jgi:hypothetical protein
MRAVAIVTAVALVAFATGIASFASADEGGPTVTLSSDSASSTNAATIAVTAQFSEEVSDFDAGAVTVTNGTVDNVATTTTDNEYTFDVTPTAEGDVTVQIAENAVTSASSSIGNVESNTLTFTSDMTAPTISDVSVSAIGTSTATINWTTDEPTTGTVNYGTDSTYGASTTVEDTASTTHSIQLSDLDEGTVYHYQISQTNAGGTTTTDDATFVTSSTASSTPLAVDDTDTVKSDGVADNQFSDGWKWLVHFTVPDNEDAFRIRFSDWGNASSSFPADGNMRLSIAQSDNASTTDSGLVLDDNTYSDWFYLTGDADAGTPGRQVDLSVEVKIPFGTANGSYTSNFTAQTYPQTATSTATD